jgi:hypothetical protein
VPQETAHFKQEVNVLSEYPNDPIKHLMRIVNECIELVLISVKLLNDKIFDTKKICSCCCYEQRRAERFLLLRPCLVTSALFALAFHAIDLGAYFADGLSRQFGVSSDLCDERP